MQTNYTPDDVARFWSKVDQSGGPGACWLWTTGCFSGGYGAFTVRRKVKKSHRVSWELTNGPIADGMFICHHCDNPRCVNPSHLFLGTPADNMHDRDKKGRACRTPGSERWSSKLTEADILDIRARYVPRKVTLAFLAEEYGVTFQDIWHIVHRKTWTHV